MYLPYLADDAAGGAEAHLKPSGEVRPSCPGARRLNAPLAHSLSIAEVQISHVTGESNRSSVNRSRLGTEFGTRSNHSYFSTFPQPFRATRRRFHSLHRRCNRKATGGVPIWRVG